MDPEACQHVFPPNRLMSNNGRHSFHYQRCVHCETIGFYGKKYGKKPEYEQYGKYYVKDVMTKGAKT
tara:strand:- start:269 stop:469 length:201 start_codon:yes stop_codon:yes gene_type:complete